MVMKTNLNLIIYYDSIGKTTCHLIFWQYLKSGFFRTYFSGKKWNFDKLLLKIYDTFKKKKKLIKWAVDCSFQLRNFEFGGWRALI